MTSLVTAAEVQTYVGVDVPLDLTTAGALAAIASSLVLGFLERDIELGSYDDYVDGTGRDYVLLPHWPIQSVSLFSVDGTTSYPAAAQGISGWRVDPLVSRKLQLTRCRIGRGAMNVHVTYTAGYDLTAPRGDIRGVGLPNDIAQATLLTAAAVQNASIADPNLLSENTAGVFGGTFHQGGVGSLPPGARTLLLSYRRVAP